MRVERCFDHAIVGQLNQQCLAHFSSVAAQLVGNRIACSSAPMKRASIIARYLAELVMFRPLGKMPVSSLYGFVNERVDLGTGFRLLMLKLRMDIVDRRPRVGSFGFVLEPSLPPHIER